MAAAKAKRRESLLPGGVPRYVRCYDDGEETIDRYTVVFTGRYRHRTGGEFVHLMMSDRPFHPQGFGQHGSARNQIDVTGSSWAGPSIGRKCFLGVRIPFDALPEDCRKLVLSDYTDLWEL